MKRTVIYTVTLCAAALLSTGCLKSDKVDHQTKQTTGTLDAQSIELVVNDEATVNTADFIVTILDGSANQVASWKYSSRPVAIDLEQGEYSIVVTSSEEQQTAQWDTPHYTAVQKVNIVKQETTTVGNVETALDNIGVKVNYTKALADKMAANCRVSVRIGAGELVYEPAETRTGYFVAGVDKHVLTAEFTGTVAGESVNETRIIKDVMAGQRKTLTFDIVNKPDTIVTPPDTTTTETHGGAGVNFSIDVTCTTVDVDGNITIQEGEEQGDSVVTEDKGVPTIVWAGHDLDQMFELTDPNTAVKIDIAAPNKIKTLTVDIISDAPAFSEASLKDVGLDSHLDLSNPGALKEAIQGLHFPVEEQVVGQTSVCFDITGFMPLMSVVTGYKVEFKITVTDMFGHELSKSLKMDVKL